MKGTFFSADFVTDQNDNLRLLEINTDTGYGSTNSLDIFDYSEFIAILTTNNISEVHVVYKPGIQENLFQHLSTVLEASASTVTTISSTKVNGNSIFPSSPVDSENIFILRMAYDETAILDSEYAKGTLNLLKLFADNSDTDSIINFHHSSSVHGNYNTLVEEVNPSNVPDLAVKAVSVDHNPVTFHKIGNVDLPLAERFDTAINILSDSTTLIQQYTLNADYETNNKVSSVRSYHIVYGSNLDICSVASYELEAMFELPTSIEVNLDENVGLIPVRHYYEFATNTVATPEHGLLADELVVTMDGSEIPVSTMQSGSTYPSYFIADAPNTDDDDTLAAWSYNGTTLPTGSYSTSSLCIDVIEFHTYTNTIVKLTFDGGDTIELGGANRLLVHNDIDNKIQYVRVGDLTTNYSVFDSNENLVAITSVDFEILAEPATLYIPNMEDVDTFLIGASGGKIIKLVSHNVITCFPAGTQITLADGSTKNVEDVIVGDDLITLNETTKLNETKKVLELKQGTTTELVKYTLSNGTTVTATPEHPFYVNLMEIASLAPQKTAEVYGFDKRVKKIEKSDCVYQLPGMHAAAIQTIELQKVEATDVFTFTVEDNHNFYANNILVHNK